MPSPFLSEHPTEAGGGVEEEKSRWRGGGGDEDDVGRGKEMELRAGIGGLGMGKVDALLVVVFCCQFLLKLVANLESH